MFEPLTSESTIGHLDVEQVHPRAGTLVTSARTWTLVLKGCVVGRLGRLVIKVQNEYHGIYQAINDTAAESDLRQLK